MRVFIILFFCIPLLSFAVTQPDYEADLQKKIKRHWYYAFRSYSGYFKRAQVTLPPKELAILVFKQNKRLELYARDDHKAPWTFIRSYRIYAASGGPGPKLHSGDYQVPEGIYRIVGLNPDSHYDLSLQLNYPNSFDREFAVQDHRMNLGKNIFIHGKHKSIGCIAIGDHAIEQLFPLVYFVGVDHVKVVIAPDDLRVQPPIFGQKHPKWLTILYGKIKGALSRFPIHA